MFNFLVLIKNFLPIVDGQNIWKTVLLDIVIKHISDARHRMHLINENIRRIVF